MITTLILSAVLFKPAPPIKFTAQRVETHANVLIENHSSRSFVIPAAGSLAAGGGSLFFRSDVTLVNNDDVAQEIAVLWLPIGGGAPQTFRLSPALPADIPPVTVVDFVGTVLGINGLGSLVFIAVDASGNPDPVSSLDGFSRIWTRQPGSAGTVSQPFPAVDPDHLRGRADGFLIGLRQDAGFRTNYGIVNLHAEPQTFLVTVFPERNGGPDGYVQFSVSLGGLSMTQASIPAGDFGALTLIVTPDSDAIPWTAYASSTDNTTGDGWVSIASAFLLPEEVPAR